MGVLNNLGLRRPAPPPIAATGKFQLDGVTVVNPMLDRRSNATIEVSNGAVAGKAGFKNTILLEDASARAADAAAVRVKATGATFLKFYEGLTEPMIRALEQACAKHGLKMMGHVPAGMRYEDARIAEVQHFF